MWNPLQALQTFAARWSTPAWAVAYAAQSLVTQRATYVGGHAVKKYATVLDATIAFRHTTYRLDTVNSLVDSLTGLPSCVGNVAKKVTSVGGVGPKEIDFLRHPSQMQTGIDAGTATAPIAVGDCEDSAAWFAAMLTRSGLGTGIELVALWWKDAMGQSVGHMVCRYTATGGPGGIGPEVGRRFWIGNWHSGAPYEGEVISGIEGIVKAPVKTAVAWSVGLGPDDTLLLSRPRVLRS